MCYPVGRMGSKLKENKASTSYLKKSSANSIAFVVKQVKFNTMLKGHGHDFRIG
jgi:hypothetical protein